MKTKKLGLNKKTITRLNNDELKDVKGGKPAPLTYTCDGWWITRCGSNPCC